jgi:Tol biopolymer transport system component
VTYVTQEVIDSPAWSAGGDFLIFRNSGQPQRIPVKGGTPESSAARPDTGKTPHVSPDGKQGATLAGSHPNTLLTVTDTANKSKRVIAKLPAGGTIGVNPWSPDGKRLTFISYQWLQ